MDDKFIPDDVEQFLLDRIDSVEELEALLLLRNDPEKQWTIQDVSKSRFVFSALLEEYRRSVLSILCRFVFCRGVESSRAGI